MALETIALLILVVTSCTAQNYETRLCMKEIYNSAKPAIATGAQTFVDFITESNVFLDKSLIIKEILNNTEKIISITRPPRWGKSLVINMMKTFLEIPIDKYGNKTSPSDATPNYRLFVKGEVTTSNGELVKLRSPLLIGQQQETVNEHLAKYAVIYCNFSHIQGNNYKTLMKAIRTRISDTYKQHNYLVHVLGKIANRPANEELYPKLAAQKRLESVTDILTNEHRLNGGDVEHSLSTLAEVLSIYMEIPVFLLIDEFDAPLRAFLSIDEFSEEENEDFLEFYASFIRLTFTNTNIKKAFITGIHPFADEHYKLVYESITEYTFFDGELMKFYGMNKSEIDAIYQYVHLTRTKIGVANSFYSHCRYQFYNNITDMNNPWAIANYLATLEKKDWMNVTQLENLIGFFIQIDHKWFEIQFRTLIKDLGLLVELKYVENVRLTLDELRILYRALVAPDDAKKFKQQVLQYYIPTFSAKIYTFLQTNGFVSVYMSCPRHTPSGMVRFRFPIRDYYKHLQDVIDHYFYKIIEPMIDEASPQPDDFSSESLAVL